MKPFLGLDADHLCRHSDETDTCGQGPTDYEEDDVEDLLHPSGRFVFARKFKPNRDDPARQKVVSAIRTSSYYSDLADEGLNEPMIRFEFNFLTTFINCSSSSRT